MARKILGVALICSLVGCGKTGDSGARETAKADQPSNRPAVSSDSRPVILFFGTSLTAGLGLDPDEAYPTLIQRKIDSAGLKYRAVNAGLSGETSAAGVRRIEWILRQPVAVLVMEMGANDALRGLELKDARKNLQQIIDSTRARYTGVAVVIAGMQAPPNLGSRYTKEFQQIFVDLARDNHAALIPFLLQDVGGIDSLNQRDGIHPNVQGEKIVAENVWKVLEPILKK
jgi:acyl-CoA thioesterase I